MKKLTDNDYFIQNDYIDKILENPDDYDYLDLILTSIMTPYYYKLYDYMLLNYGLDEDEDTEVFREFLYNYSKTDDYINKIANSNDEILKANLVIFIENDLFNPMFGTVNNFIKKVSNYKDYSAKYKIGPLIAISNFDCSDEDIINIKSAIKYLALNDEEYKNEFGKKELLSKIEDYYKQIDQNHSKEKSYILNI